MQFDAHVCTIRINEIKYVLRPTQLYLFYYYPIIG